jgi:hypothetical protein
MSAAEPVIERGDVDDDLEFILPEIQKLGLTPKAQNELLARGPQQALAICFAAQKPGVRHPAGMAVSLMTHGGPSEADLAQAKIALDTRCLDREEADRLARRQEYDRLNARTLEAIAEKAADEELPHESTLPLSDGLDTPIGKNPLPDGSRLTVKDYWVAALGQLSLQLGKATFEGYVKGTRALSYADGVLTVQARHLMAHEILIRHDWLTNALSKVAGMPIQVHVVLSGEVGR